VRRRDFTCGPNRTSRLMPPAELKRPLQVISRGATLNSLELTLHVDHELDDIFPFCRKLKRIVARVARITVRDAVAFRSATANTSFSRSALLNTSGPRTERASFHLKQRVQGTGKTS
jgi:hypothetical protein